MLMLMQAGEIRGGSSARGTPTEHRELGRYVDAHRKSSSWQTYAFRVWGDAGQFKRSFFRTSRRICDRRICAAVIGEAAWSGL